MFYNYFNKYEYGRTETVTSLIESSMKKHKDRTAIVFNGKNTTYGELDRISGKLAGYLASHGAGKDKAVAILLPRSDEMVFAAIGVLRAGSAYQPLDPSYPDERLEFMVNDSEAPILITDSVMRKRLPDYKGHVFDIADLESLPVQEGELPKVDPDSLFVLLYTSGSTGIPKGVMLEHRNLVNFIHWYRDYYGITEESRDAAYASFGFDAFMMNTYPILSLGGQMHVIDEAIRTDFPVLYDYFEKNGITQGFITTQVGRQFARLYPSCGALKNMTVGGETLVPLDPPSGYKFHNAYGPTECTILTTCFEVDRLYDSVPIGKPVYNTKLYIVDANGNQVENGQEGELWISGPLVGRGYLKRPEKTAEAFIKNPFSDEEGYERIYRTGDIVIGCDDGNILFIGRRDTQVKIRGFRIELSEVEEVIRRFEGIKDATVAAFDKATGGKYIAAYVVSDMKVDTGALTAFIKQSKPPYMVPAVIMQIDEIPLNQNQKVDRKKLPVPELKNENYEAPVTEMEKFLCKKMELALELDQVGINDDFFEIGGDSITAIRYIMECNHPGVDTASIYKYRTPKALAAYCESAEKNSRDVEEEDAKALREPQGITYDQKVLVMLQQMKKDSAALNEPYLFRLKKGTDTDQLISVIEKLVKHHPALLTRIDKNKDGEFELCYDETLFTPLEIIDTTEEEFEQIKKTLVKPFGVTGNSFMRAAVYRTGTYDYLFIDIHHLISDGYSIKLFFDEINACMADPEHKLPADHYYYLLKRYNDRKSSDTYREAENYYRENYYEKGNLKNASLMLKRDHDSGENKSGMEMIPLPIKKSSQTNNLFFMTAAALAIAEYNGTDRAFLYWIHEGRDSSEDMSAFGYMIKTLPFYLVTKKGETSKQVLQRAKEQVEFAKTHAEYPFLSTMPQVSSLIRFVYQKNLISERSPVEAAEEQIRLDLSDRGAVGSLGIGVVDNDGDDKLILGVKYSSSMYDKESIIRFCSIYASIAEKLTDPDAVIRS